MLIFLPFFLVLLTLGVPVLFALLLAPGIVTLFLDPRAPAAINGLFRNIYSGIDSFILMAIPFFIFVGVIMDAGGISRRIVAWSFFL